VRRRAPDAVATLDASAGVPFETLAAELRERAGGSRLAALATDAALLERLVAAAVARTPELAVNPPAPDAEEIRAIYRAAAR
jgi:alcohol dehydrogenase class IV